MRLRRLDLTRYGKFTDYAIDFGEHVAGRPDFHIVYGLNEAGKSTALAAYLDLLFGIDERTKYGFLHHGKAMEIGACLEFNGAVHELRRVKQRSNSLLNEHGEPLYEALMSVPLAGLTRDAYRTMFCLDDQTLEDGGNAILESKGDLGELLFSASAGLAGVSSILEAAVTEAEGIFRRRASTTKIATLKRQITAFKSQRDEIDVQASAYRALTTALEQAEAAYDAAMNEIGKAKSRSDAIFRILRALPLAAEYRRSVAQLSEYSDLPHAPIEWVSILPDLAIKETQLQTELIGIAQREQKIREELDRLLVEDGLLEIADQLDRLNEAAARYATAQEDLPKRRLALSESNSKVDLLLARLGQEDVADPKSLLISAATIGTLRELLNEKSGTDVARLSAEQEHQAALEALEKEMRDRQAEDGQRSSMDAGRSAELQAAVRNWRDGNFVAELRVAARAVPVRRQDFEDAVSGLYPWSGDGQALRLVSPPHHDRIASWKIISGGLEKRRSQIVERKRELATAQAESAAGLTALRDAIDIMDDDEAKAVLLEREEAWLRHLAALNRETADRFETHMRANDAVAAARLSAIRQLEELRSLTRQLAGINASLDRQNQLLEEVEEEQKALRDQIRTETPAEIALSLDASVESWLIKISQWVETRKSALIAWDHLRSALNDAEQARLALASQQTSLVTALGNAGVAAEGLNMLALIQAAETILTELAATQVKRLEAAKRYSNLELSVAQRQVALDKAAAASAAWQKRWEKTLAETWLQDKAGAVGAVRELLDLIAHLHEALRERDNLQHRIEAMEMDQTFFAESVAQLYGALHETLDGHMPLDAAKALLRRHENAKLVEAKRRERNQVLVDLAGEHERCASESALHAARKREMTDFFQVATLADVRLALERCRERDELLAQQNRCECQILADLPLPTLDVALASLADADLAELQREQAELQTRLEGLDMRAKQLFADKERAADRLSAVGGDDAVSRIEGSRRTLLLEMEDLALRYLRLKTGSLVAQHGIRAYREKHRSAMMNRASEAFRLITRNEYTGLATRPEKDREVLIGLSRSGGSKLAVEMSKGTQFQLYLALRLAGYEEFAATRPSVPFIADDIMETFDELRSVEVFRLLGQLAMLGQVIYLTHHRHLCELGKQAVPIVTIHELV